MRWISFLSGLLPASIQVVLLTIFARRRLYHRFPFFSAYTLYSVLASAAQLAVLTRPIVFFVVYWTTEIIYSFLALLAIREVFKGVLDMNYSIYPWTRWLPPAAIVGTIELSLWEAVHHYPTGPIFIARLGTFSHWFIMGVLGLEVAVFLICLCLRFKQFHPFLWSPYEAGILVGFGAAAMGGGSMYLARFSLGPVMELAFRYIPQVAYLAASLIWLKAFYNQEPPIESKPLDPELYKRAAELMRRAIEAAEKDLGMRRSLS